MALALHYRDDICACTTRACWHQASAAFRGSIGLAVPQTEEESRTIASAFGEVRACLDRIYTAELAVGALEASP